MAGFIGIVRLNLDHDRTNRIDGLLGSDLDLNGLRMSWFNPARFGNDLRTLATRNDFVVQRRLALVVDREGTDGIFIKFCQEVRHLSDHTTNGME